MLFCVPPIIFPSNILLPWGSEKLNTSVVEMTLTNLGDLRCEHSNSGDDYIYGPYGPVVDGPSYT